MLRRPVVGKDGTRITRVVNKHFLIAVESQGYQHGYPWFLPSINHSPGERERKRGDLRWGEIDFIQIPVIPPICWYQN